MLVDDFDLVTTTPLQCYVIMLQERVDKLTDEMHVLREAISTLQLVPPFNVRLVGGPYARALAINVFSYGENPLTTDKFARIFLALVDADIIVVDRGIIPTGNHLLEAIVDFKSQVHVPTIANQMHTKLKEHFIGKPVATLVTDMSFVNLERVADVFCNQYDLFRIQMHLSNRNYGTFISRGAVDGELLYYNVTPKVPDQYFISVQREAVFMSLHGV